jgi:dTDP-4-amino-4,6-dideoxygalactose transaminase
MQTKTEIKVPLLDLNAEYAPIKADIMKAIEEVVDSKQFIMGPKVIELEKQVAEYCQTKHAIGVSSGTDALVISLMGLDIAAGDEVITTAFTFFATAGSIARVGATPVFVDIDPKTLNIDPSKIEEKITSKTKAIVPVHLFGQMAEMDPIMEIAKKHNLSVIEDGAQAIGSEYNGKRAGSIGDTGCFSFFPSKNLGCCGDGGIVTTNNDELAEKLRTLRVHGSKPKYYHHIIGGNFRLDPLQASVLLVKLPRLESQHKGRQKNAEFYNANLKNVEIPFIEENRRMIYNQYTVRSQNRDNLQQQLKEANIGNMVYYPVPLHVQSCFDYLGYKEGDLPETEKAAKEVLSIPIYPDLSQEQLDYIVATINT